jgi:hypothetical protein
VLGAVAVAIVNDAGARKVRPSGRIRTAATTVVPVGRFWIVVIGVSVTSTVPDSAVGGTVRVNWDPLMAWVLIVPPATPIDFVTDAPASTISCGARTVPVALFVRVPLDAVIVAVPGRTPRVVPVDVTVIRVVSELLQVMVCPTIGAPC